MSQTGVQMAIPFESLVESITRLSPREKLQLWQLLTEQVAQLEEELWEQDPTAQAEIREAREAYQAGDYVTIDEYLARQQSTS